MANPLQAADEVTVRASDTGHIRAKLMALSARQTWLSAGHSIPSGNPPGNAAAFNAHPPADIIELVAVRGPLHGIDGWGYLARALSALISGDGHAARHLAYYAELRAALSILANDGIGIFNRQNRVVDSHGDLLTLENRGTHDMCWATLAFWAAEPGSIDKLLQATRINGAPILDAIQTFFPGMSAGSLGGTLIQEWGFDLRNGHEDRDERNLSSYSPNDLTPAETSPADDVAFVRTLWNAFEPNTWSLERHLLRKLLELLQGVVGGAGLSERANEYDHLDERIRSSVSMDFLVRIVEPENHPLLMAASSNAKPAPAHSMIARGALLLALAGGMSGENLRESMIRPFEHLRGWWHAYGSERGLWAPGREPDDMMELWLEVSDALASLEQTPNSNRYEWLNGLEGAVLRLCEAERIGLWNLCR
jgi:hypothetical protein